jgi:glutamine synthetase
MRSKAKVIKKIITSLEEVPEWNFDGSSCQQAKTLSSEIILKPVAIYKDPFRLMHNLLVLCETYQWKDNTF